MKTLETDRLILRLFQENDLDDFFEYAQVEGVGEMAGWRHHKSIEESRKILQHFIESKEVYAVYLKEHHKVIGSIGLHKRTEDETKRDIGYVLNKNYWNKGLITESVKRVIKYGFDDLGLNAITVGHFVNNEASQRVIEKSGFRFLEDGLFYASSLGEFIADKKYILTKEMYDKNINLYKENL